MPRSTEAARKGPSTDTPTTKTDAVKSGLRKAVGGKSRAGKASTAAAPVVETAGGELATAILGWLDEAKAEEILAMDIRGKTSFADCMIVATGRSDRQVGAIADQLQKHLREYGVSNVRVEGMETCDWVLVDVGAIIVNLFRPDVREYYNLEKMWMGERPSDQGDESDATH
jgi:ribosome-associated protein